MPRDDDADKFPHLEAVAWDTRKPLRPSWGSKAPQMGFRRTLSASSSTGKVLTTTLVGVCCHESRSLITTCGTEPVAEFVEYPNPRVIV